MDINSLLSPQESVLSGTSTPAGPPLSPHKGLRRARSTSLRQGMTSSPLAHHVLAPAQLPEPSPLDVSSTSGPTTGGGTGTPPSSELQPTRGPSTPGMDTLADLASMQHHQPQRSNAPILRNAESYGSQLSLSTMYPNVQTITHNTPTPRSSFDIAMSDAPREAARRNYVDTSLPPDAQGLATQLFLHIQETPHAYESHLKFIQLLHQGFVNHVYPPSDPEAHGNPQRYDLLKDLRTAREQMDKLFAMGEDLWAEWIQDESMLAQNVEERIAVMELCQRSVEEEFGSTKLWVIFGDWMLYLYNSAFQDGGQWSEEDKLVGQEVFNWQSVLDVWKRGADATTWRINDSHVVWNKYLELVIQDLSNSPSSDKISEIRTLFDNRLKVPHANWDKTFELFSNFVSNYCNARYEQIMVDTNTNAADGKAKYNARQDMEANLACAIESGDRNAEWTILANYIEWEVSQSRKKHHFNFDLANAVFQRAVLRFPTDAGFWEDYVMFSIDESMHGHTTIYTIPSLERATRHCPWSGSLWSQHLLSSEREGSSFNHIADIKHKATSTGLLDAGGMEEVLKVHATWCSYLRRRAFQAESTDEDLDVAEVGIRSAIESVQELGEKKYGKLYEGDPVFRLERIYIRYLSDSGSYDSARETFKGLIKRRGNSYEFWMIYYSWELVSWGKFVRGDATADASRKTPNPSYATAVLKQALRRTDLDWPEKIMSAYMSHCEDYEDAEELQIAVVQVRKAAKAVARKREIAAQEAAAQQTEQQLQSAVQNHVSPTGKRKRGEEADTESANKKPKPGKNEFMAAERPGSEPVEPKRDRENSTVVVKNIPKDVTETKIKQYFGDCGTIKSLKVLSAENDTATAIIELETKEDALAAQTRDQKSWNGNIIEVQIGSGTTVFVANFPPTADEAFIRNLFNSYGEIIDVRMPSLKYNTHRRFCYVQFRSPGSAYEATQLNDSVVGENLKIVVKISDPSKRESRTGPVHEGREIHVSNIDWKANDDDLNELFSAYGRVESVRIPTKVGGGIKGFGFVVFSSKDEANAALEMDQKDFRNRPLQVQLSTPGGAKRQATNIISHVSQSKSPSVEPNSGSTPTPASGAETTASNRHMRSLGLMNIPDTVNDARVRALVEPYGPLVKIVLRPDHQGALVEFAEAGDAGKASLGLEGREIIPGRRIRVGTVPEMLKQAPERKGDPTQAGKKKDATKAAMMAQPAGPVKRPQQPGGRGGRRGGLGKKRNGVFSSHNAAKPAEPNDTAAAAGEDVEEKKALKSNDDFRAMLQKKS